MKVNRRSKLRTVIARTVRNARDAASAGAREAYTSMQRDVPVRTGYLKSTIEENPVDENTTEINVGADYGVDVEFKQPYFRPGVDAGRRKMRERLKIGGK